MNVRQHATRYKISAEKKRSKKDAERKRQIKCIQEQKCIEGLGNYRN
jgi:hypothetical protein